MAVAKSNRNCESTIFNKKQTSKLEDRYCLGEQLGWGQFGVIRTCTDKLTGEVFACKSISKDRSVTSYDLRSVKLEIEIMSRLSGHPNVVHLKAVYEEEDYVHLVMELCAGGELYHQLEKVGCFGETEARIIFRHLIEVVSYCHENGIVHRDLKPENILLSTRSSSSPIKLADFGLATYIQPGQCLHGLVGSPFYIAPEVLAGSYNEAADVWSAGVILYILLSGIPPFRGKTKSRIFDAVRASDLMFPSEFWDHISQSAKDLIKGMLCTDPSQRLTAKQILDHSWMDDSQWSAEPISAHQTEKSEVWEVGSSPHSALLVSRNLDISFGLESPRFSCWSSFSSFLVEPLKATSEDAVFPFRSIADSSGLKIASSVPSMGSFAFFSPCPSEKSSCELEFSTCESNIQAIHREAILEKVFVLDDSPVDSGNRMEQIEPMQVEFKRQGELNGYTMSGIDSKMNFTIGLRNNKQLNHMVSESLIHWSSCVHLPTSIRSSLVC